MNVPPKGKNNAEILSNWQWLTYKSIYIFRKGTGSVAGLHASHFIFCSCALLLNCMIKYTHVHVLHCQVCQIIIIRIFGPQSRLITLLCNRIFQCCLSNICNTLILWSDLRISDISLARLIGHSYTYST